MPEPTHDERLASVEVQLSAVAKSLGEFVDESRQYRKEQRETEQRMWDAIGKSKPAITWPMIVSTCTFLTILVGMSSGLGHFFVEMRVGQTDKDVTANRRDIDRHEKALEKIWDRALQLKP
jgi:hypothetical protein